MVADWGDEGEIDLLDWFAELTIYTTSSCLIGKPFREELDSSFAQHYHDLEKGTDALAFVDPYADIESFHQRDAGRDCSWSSSCRRSSTSGTCAARCPREERDLLDVLISLKDEDGSDHFSADEITGMFISMMFAGHHTSSGTAAWTLIELLRHPEVIDGRHRRARRAVRRRLGRLLPGAARDPAAGGGAQGDAAPAPAADPAAARGQGGDRDRRPHRSRPAPWSAPPRRCRTGSPRTSPSPTALRPGPLPRPPAGGPHQPLDLDPLRRRPAPLRRQRLRDDAAQGDLLGDPARLRVRAEPALGDLPRRLLEDGDPARAAVPGAGTARRGRSRP